MCVGVCFSCATYTVHVLSAARLLAEYPLFMTDGTTNPKTPSLQSKVVWGQFRVVGSHMKVDLHSSKSILGSAHLTARNSAFLRQKLSTQGLHEGPISSRKWHILGQRHSHAPPKPPESHDTLALQHSTSGTCYHMGVLPDSSGPRQQNTHTAIAHLHYDIANCSTQSPHGTSIIKNRGGLSRLHDDPLFSSIFSNARAGRTHLALAVDLPENLRKLLEV